jgi:tRNAThr (cytosine32-N3)-methyltransferase
VYFFEEPELREIWSGNIPVNGSKEGEEAAEPIKVPGLEVLNLGVDRRMLVNRQRKIKMYRCWMQGRFRKAKDEPAKDAPAQDEPAKDEHAEA